MVYSGVRMVAIGAITSTITFLVGRLVGVTIS
jgi:VIT1/CCC1 family predicted Fe2+/Mn2+ transporter